ncbi:MAG: TMEM165/GDT1 family protein [Magnetococcales bacterium]|nr:TMEM165/GDT1 family protein [Magnetococcales bacterium]
MSISLSLAAAFPTDLTTWLTTTTATFLVIFLAELGDKTQLVCMTLAARYQGRPVFLGASLAFVFLNILAVVFGAALSQWVPERVLAGIVAALFAFFGIQSLRSAGDDDQEEEDVSEKSGRGIMLTAFLMIFVAELGDKTQIAVAGMAVTQPAGPVWVGATVALILSSALGVIVGRKLLQRIPIKVVHKVAGIFFLLLAGLALIKVF